MYCTKTDNKNTSEEKRKRGRPRVYSDEEREQRKAEVYKEYVSKDYWVNYHKENKDKMNDVRRLRRQYNCIIEKLEENEKLREKIYKYMMKKN